MPLRPSSIESMRPKGPPPTIRTSTSRARSTITYPRQGTVVVSKVRIGSAPSETRGDMGENRLDDVRVVVDAQLIWHGQQQRVGLRDSLVSRQLLDENVRL